MVERDAASSTRRLGAHAVCGVELVVAPRRVRLGCVSLHERLCNERAELPWVRSLSGPSENRMFSAERPRDGFTAFRKGTGPAEAPSRASEEPFMTRRAVSALRCAG